jgi:hypothetical protein
VERQGLLGWLYKKIGVGAEAQPRGIDEGQCGVGRERDCSAGSTQSRVCNSRRRAGGDPGFSGEGETYCQWAVPAP